MSSSPLVAGLLACLVLLAVCGIWLVKLGRRLSACEKARESLLQQRDLVLADAPRVAWERFADGGIVFSAGEERIFGAAIGADGWRTKVHPDDLPALNAGVLAAFDGGGVFEADYRWRGQDQSWRVLRARGQAVGAAGSRRLVGVTEDVTDRLNREQRAALAEARFQILADAIPGLLFATDPVGSNTYVNRVFEEFSGLPNEALLGRGWIQLVHKEDVPRIRLRWERATAVGESYEAEYRFRRHDGEWRWFLVRSRPARGADGSINQWVGVAVEIEDRRRIEAALRASDERLRDLLAILDLATVFIRDWDGTIRFWSHGCERLYGWSAAEALGKHAQALLGTEYPIPLAEIEGILLREGEWRGDLIHVRRDGAKLVIAAHKALRRNTAGEPDSVLESVVDVTTLREAQTELRLLNGQLELRVREEVAAREEAQNRAALAERMQALGQLAGGIAHDINNVLQAVIAGAAAIERRPDRDAPRYARLILQAGQRGAAVTRRLLAFARRSELRGELIDAGTLLSELRHMLEATLGPHIAIELDCPDDLPCPFADSGQLETVLVNLAANARDAMEGGGELTIRLRAESVQDALTHPAALQPGNYVRITVSDTGAGMDAATLARASEPFFTTKARGEGTGLGLAMARGFAEQSGGGFAIASRRGHGTQVTLWLPVLTSGSRPSDGAGAESESLLRNLPPRVLLVDDDDAVRDMLSEELRSLDLEVTIAASAEAGTAMLAANPRGFDLLITDLAMPGRDGLSLIRQARRLVPDIPVVLLSGYVEESAAIALSTADDRLTAVMAKPVSLPQLMRRIVALMDRRLG